VAAILVVTALVPTVILPLLSGGGAGNGPDTTSDAGLRNAPSVPAIRTSPGPAVIMATAPPASRPPSGVGGTSAGGSVPGSPPAPPAPPPPAQLPLALEAEASGVSLQRAQVETIGGASGGRGARFTGTPGRVRFSSVAVAAGTYRITITYAPAAQAGGTVQGTDGQVGITFAAGSGCCATVSAQVPMLAGGMLTIRLTSAGGTYPAIDRVVIESV
jgi:hypothetical protein